MTCTSNPRNQSSNGHLLRPCYISKGQTDYAESLEKCLQKLVNIRNGRLEALHKCMLQSMLVSVQQGAECCKLQDLSPDIRQCYLPGGYSEESSPLLSNQTQTLSSLSSRWTQDYINIPFAISEGEEGYGEPEINDTHSRTSPFSLDERDCTGSWGSSSDLTAQIDKTILREKSLLIGYVYSSQGSESSPDSR